MATPDNIARVAELFSTQANTSVRSGAQMLNLKRITALKILVANFLMFPYKIQIYHALNQNQITRLLDFAERLNGELIESLFV